MRACLIIRTMDDVPRGTSRLGLSLSVWFGGGFHPAHSRVGTPTWDVEGNFLPSGISQFDQFYSYYAIPGGIIGILSAYAIYKSARSLAPMNRTQIIDKL